MCMHNSTIFNNDFVNNVQANQKLGTFLFCFYFYLFFFPAILFFPPIMLNILSKIYLFCLALINVDKPQLLITHIAIPACNIHTMTRIVTHLATAGDSHHLLLRIITIISMKLFNKTNEHSLVQPGHLTRQVLISQRL